MTFLILEPYDFILNTWAVTRADALDSPGIQRRTMQILKYHLVSFRIRVGHVAVNDVVEFLLIVESKRHYLFITALLLHD